MSARIRRRTVGMLVLIASLVIALGATPAWALGTISGHVWRGNGGAMNGGAVYLYSVNAEGNLTFVTATSPNSSGFYTLDVDATKSYKLMFTPVNSYYAVNGLWSSHGLVPHRLFADAITVSDGGNVTCDTTIPVAFTVEGTVTAHATGNGIESLGFVPYVLNEATGEWLDMYGSDTRDAPDAGRFSPAFVPGYKYRLRFGFDYYPWSVQFYNGAGTVLGGTTLTGGPGDTIGGLSVVMRVNVTSETVAGEDRVLTAIAASQKLYPDGGASPGAVVITTGYNWPDALGGSALAGYADAPILLTKPRPWSLNDPRGAVLKAEVERLHAKGASRAYVLGGESSVSSTVFNELVAIFGPGNVLRLGGADRYATAARIATTTINGLGPAFDGTLFVANGKDYPDALSAAPLAARLGWPVILAQPDGHGGLSDALTSLVGTYGKKAIILGSTQSVSSGVEADLANALGGSGKVERWWGPNRYATSVEIAKHGVEEHGMAWDALGFANGAMFPDGLCAAPLLASSGSVLLLTPNKASLPASLTAELKTLAGAATTSGAPLRSVRFFGGWPNTLAIPTRDALLNAAQ